jgi:hypothetical protein
MIFYSCIKKREFIPFLFFDKRLSTSRKGKIMAKNTVAADVSNETETESKRAKVSTFAYIDNGGNVSKQVTPKSIGLVVEFANGTKDRIDIDQLSNEMLACATLQGLAIKLQRSFASAKGDANEALEAYETVRDNLLAGVWAVKGEGSAPRLTILAEAIAAVLEAAGRTPDLKDIAEKLKDESVQEKASKDPKVKAQYERIKAERAAERAKKAGEAAAKTDGDGVSDLF